MASHDGSVDYRQDGDLGIITLNRAQAHNAFTVAMLRQLLSIIDAAKKDDSVRVLVITGAGEKAFCVGGDLGELIPRLTQGELDILIPDSTKRFFSDVYKPVVAAINGICVGGGFEIMLGTDIRIASSQATFGLPEVRWGQIPGGGTHVRITQQIPWASAMQLLLTGDTIDADKALRIGLVGEVVPPDQVLPRALELARHIASNAPVAVQTAKEIAVRAWGNQTRFDLEHTLNARVLSTQDALEGPRAFMERRKPNYQNR